MVNDAVNDVACMCPQCLSSNITTSRADSTLVQPGGAGDGGQAVCGTCGWTGKAAELAAVPFGNPFGDRARTLDAFAHDVLMTAAKECVLPFGQLLIRWGFVDKKKIDHRQFSRYIVAIAKAATQAIIETSRAIAGGPAEEKSSAKS